MSTLKYNISRFRFYLKKILKKESFEYNEKVQDIVSQIKENGFAIVADFYTQDECSMLRDEIDNLIIKRKNENRLWEDPYDADKRCFAAEEDSKLIEKFFKNNFLNSVADNYFKAKMTCSNTLAARIQYRNGNVGSGQGWHRDGNNMQFKAIVYLSDVDLKDGPFQIIQGSHKPKAIKRHIKLMNHDGVELRMNNKQIEEIKKIEPNNYKVLIAKAGTLVFADTSTIHTGMALSEGGERYTLFNYYYPSYENIEARRKIFKNAHKQKI